MQKDVQYVHDMGGVSGNFTRLVIPLVAHWIRSRVLLVDCLLVLAAAVLSLELLDAVSISFKLARYFRLVELPGIAPAEPGVVFLCIQIHNIAQYGHKGEEESENVVPVRVSIRHKRVGQKLSQTWRPL